MTIPSIKVKRITLDSGLNDTMVSVDINFCAVIDNPQVAGMHWISPYTVHVVQCTSQDIAEQLKKLPKNILTSTLQDIIYSKTNREFITHRSYYIKTKQHAEYKAKVLQMNETNSSGPLEICWNSLTQPFEYEQETLNHLSYIFFPCATAEQAADTSWGTPTIEAVIENGTTVANGVVFYKQNGEVFTETPSYLPDASGAETPYGDGEPLNIVTVPNITIQDTTFLNDFIAEIIDFGENKHRARIRQPAGIFSGLALTRVDDLRQTNRFAFAINFHEIISKVVRYPGLLDNSRIIGLNQLARIREISVIRRRVSSNPNQRSEFRPKKIARIKNEEETNAGDAVPNYELSEQFLREPDREGVVGDVIGSLKEIKIFQSNESLRFFTGTDVKVNSLSGKYEYAASLQVEDLTTAFLQRVTIAIPRLLGIFDNYMTAARAVNARTRKPYWNADTSTFSSDFLSYAATRGFTPDKLFAIISAFVHIYSQISTRSISVYDYAERILRLVHPQWGTKENIYKVRQIMTKVLAGLQRMIAQPNRSKNSAAATETRTGTSSSVVNLNYTMLSYIFDNEYDPEHSRGNGYGYLPIGEPLSPTGLSSISTQDYEALIRNQHNKIFKAGIEEVPIHSECASSSRSPHIHLQGTEGDLVGITGPVDIAGRSVTPLSPRGTKVSANLTNAKTTYLSPLTLKMGDEYFSFDPTNPGFYDIEKYNINFVKILSENIAPGMSEAVKHSDNLHDMLSELYATSNCGFGLRMEDSDHSWSMEDSDFLSYDTHMDSVEHRLGHPELLASLEPEGKGDTPPTPSEFSEWENSWINTVRTATNTSSLFMLLSMLMSENNAEWFEKLLSQTIFNYNNKYNILTKFRTRQTFQELPNHLKALTSIATNREVAQVALNLDFCRLGESSRMHQAWYYENFMNLVEVQMLTGFENNSVNAPNLKRLTQSDLNSIPTGEMRIVSLVKYARNYSGISNTQEMRTPIYNEYFLLEGGARSGAISEPPQLQRSLDQSRSRYSGADGVNPANIDTSKEYAGKHSADGTAPPNKERVKLPPQGTPAKQESPATADEAGAAQAPTPPFRASETSADAPPPPDNAITNYRVTEGDY
jgi:hypothetical protein